MGCGASKEPAGAHYAAAVRSGPSWIERKDGITIEDAVTRIRAELKIKANLSDEEILAIARQQRGLEKEAEGGWREEVYAVAVEFGIWTGWETDAVDVWVGSIPASQATKGKLKRVFEQYDRVINVTVRYKPRSALDPDNNKSWAMLTFASAAGCSRALRADTIVDDDEGRPHKLKVSPQEVARNRAMRANEENGPGKMEHISALQAEEVDKRLNSKRKNGKKSSKGRAWEEGCTKKLTLAEERQQKHKELRMQLAERGLDASGAIHDLEKRLTTAAAVEGGGGGITGGFTFAHNCTLWIGGIPLDFLEGAPEVSERRFRGLFTDFGKVISVSVRKKPDPKDNYKSWGLVTFADKKDAKKVLRADVIVPTPENRGEWRREATLVTKVAKVNEELNKPDTGSLAVMWKSQENRIVAAKKIQEAVRLRRAQKKANPVCPGLAPR